MEFSSGVNKGGCNSTTDHATFMFVHTGIHISNCMNINSVNQIVS